MTTMTATEVSRNFSRILDSLEHDEKEVRIVRNRRTVARLIPEPKHIIVTEALEGLYGILSEEEGADLLRAMEQCDRSLTTEMRNPWE